MFKALKGLLICTALLISLAFFAQLPLPETVFTILAVALMIALAIAVEWPRWRHPRTTRWPNKLGQI